MTNAYELVCWLVEAANLDKAPVGIEIELGIRIGLQTPQLEEYLAEYGFRWTNDASVEMRPKSLEVYYTDFELVSDEPMSWSVLRPNLERVLAFLKREDNVEVQRTNRPIHTQSTEPVFPGEKRKTFRGPTKVVRMPRAIVPQNFTAATHLHFDHTWFDSAEHAKNFVESFNNMMAELPKTLPIARYTELPGRKASNPKRGTFYAGLEPIPTDVDTLRKTYNGRTRPKTAREYLASIGNQKNLTRYAAMNVKAVEDRGDVEFRFPHSTMNIATISGWFQTLAEMIQFATKQAGGWEEFEKHASAEAPEVTKFLATARAQSARSRDPMVIQKEPRRSVQRLLKAPKPDPKKKIRISPEIMRQAIEHEPSPEGLRTWLDRLQSIIDLEAGEPHELQAIRDRISHLTTHGVPAWGPPREEESLSRLPHFNRKIVLFLGDGQTLVIAKGGGRFFTYGVVRDTAMDLRELDLMTRDIIADHGGIRRTWVDPDH